MPKYIIKDGHKKLGGKLYAPGDTIECTEEIALQLRLVPAAGKAESKEEKKAKDKA